MLRLELSELESICNDFSLDVTGFSDIEIDVLLDNKEVQADAKSNNIPYISENEIVTQLGDIWNIGKHRIICGNSQDEKIFSKLFGDVQDKISRLVGVSSYIENGTCLFPAVAGYWWQDFKNELLLFPNSTFKDQCDALSQGIEYATTALLKSSQFYWSCVE